MIGGWAVGLALTFPFSTILHAQGAAESGTGPVRWSAGLSLGYRSGIGVKATGMVSGFTPSFPATARFGIPGPRRAYGRAARPDEANVKPRNDYTYSDADAALGQPKLEPLMMLGFRCSF